jgi:hypothetical protein
MMNLYVVFVDFSEDENVLWSLKLPPDMVEDSARAEVSVVGDLLGPVLQVRHITSPRKQHDNFLYTMYRNFLDEN